MAVCVSTQNFVNTDIIPLFLLLVELLEKGFLGFILLYIEFDMLRQEDADVCRVNK